MSFFTVEEEKIFEKIFDSDQEWKEGENFTLPKLNITLKGEPCPEPETKDCSKDPCPVDCEVDWNPPSPCNASCGGGWRTVTYKITQHPQYKGAECPANKTEECNTLACPVNCTFQWSDWSPCSASCGPGTQTSYPVNITQNPKALGKIRVKVDKRNDFPLDIINFNVKLRLYDGESTDERQMRNCSTGLIFNRDPH